MRDVVAALVACWVFGLSHGGPVKMYEDVDNRGKIPDLIRDYFYSKNFDESSIDRPTMTSQHHEDDYDNNNNGQTSRESILQSWQYPFYNIKKRRTTGISSTNGVVVGGRGGAMGITPYGNHQYVCRPKTNIILLPMLNVVAEPKSASGILKLLGVAEAPTIYADGKIDYERNREALPSIYSLPMFHRCCNHKHSEPIIQITGEDVTTPDYRFCKCPPCPYEMTMTVPPPPPPPPQPMRYFHHRNVRAVTSSKPKTLAKVFPPNTGLFMDTFSPKHRECETSEDTKDCVYDSEDTTQMVKLVMYVKKNQRPVTFVKAIELCSKRGMMLPVIRDQLDLSDIQQEAEDERVYWLGLGKSECTKDACPYEWMDGIRDTNFVSEYETEKLQPKVGPMECCTIKLSRQKSLVTIQCYSDANATAYYICTHNPPVKKP